MMKNAEAMQLINDMIDVWEEDTRHLSCHGYNHPAYSIVKKLAAKEEYHDLVITTILKRMEKNITHFFTVLSEIIPVEEQPSMAQEMQGKIKDQTEVWIKWGQDLGYLT